MSYIAPYRSQFWPYNRAYAYRGLTAFASLSLAVSAGRPVTKRSWAGIALLRLAVRLPSRAQMRIGHISSAPVVPFFQMRLEDDHGYLLAICAALEAPEQEYTNG